MRAFTVVGRNYLAHARVLARSLAETNPALHFEVFLLDDDGTLDVGEEPFGLLRPFDVFDPDEYQTLVAIYDVMELATAVKPRVLLHLLDSSDGPVVYLDPDLWFFGSLDEVERLATAHGIVLTPHTLAPVGRDGRRPEETELLRSGAYNLGFIAVGQTARPFLDWWWQRLARECIVAPERGIFVDQRWIDLVPGLFDHHILRDPGYNVAYWNLGERELTWNGERYEVDGRPLVFAHFSGFDPTKPYMLSKHTAPNPRVLLSEQPALRKLSEEYAAAMLEAGYEEARQVPFGLAVLPNRMRLDRFMRRAYRDALLEYEDPGRDADEPPPNPFAEPERFLAWLREPAGPRHSPLISRYLLALWQERGDLQSAFPDMARRDVLGFVKWVAESGRIEEGIPEPLIPSATEMRGLAGDPVEQAPLPGVNVAGYLKAELGVGEAARKMVDTVTASGEPVAVFAYSGTSSRQEHPLRPPTLEVGRDVPPYDVNIVAVNADSTSQFAIDAGPAFFDRRYTVGMWAWEVEDFPTAWMSAFDVVDEIWMNSQYAADAVARVSTKPVFSFPLPVAVPPAVPLDKKELGLPDRFLFLFSFDFLSIFERKNPLGVVEAFGRAFAPGEGPVLLVKSINGDRRLLDRERLRLAAADHPDIFLIDGYLPAETKDRLMATCDAYVSLHRSEGFGITMAEAMALGKPTIATGYSGNLEFMNDSNSYLVRYDPGSVPEGCDPYPVGARWAEPDIEHAAQLMRRVYEDPHEAQRIGERARATIEREHSPRARARLLAHHLERIRNEDHWRSRTAKVGMSRLAGLWTLDEAREAIARPIDNRWSSTPSGGMKDRLRRAALSMVRPALARERAIDERLLSSITELAERTASMEATLIDLGGTQRRLDQLVVELSGQLDEIADDIEGLAGHAAEHDRVAERLAATVDRLDALERSIMSSSEGTQTFRKAAQNHLSALSAQVTALESRMAETQRDLNARPYMADPTSLQLPDGTLGFSVPRPGDPYRDFEDVFRGEERFIRKRQEFYLALMGTEGPVLDAGSGRGEFLDLLAAEGREAIGVDLDEGMVRRCQDKGHTVVHGDVVEYLRGIDDGRFGTIFSAQFIEHVPLDALVEFLRLSVRTLRPGGVFIAETVNPHSFPAFRTFWTDLTHRAPIYPEVALTLARSAGFASARIVFPNGTGDFEHDLASEGEYAVVAHVER